MVRKIEVERTALQWSRVVAKAVGFRAPDEATLADLTEQVRVRDPAAFIALELGLNAWVAWNDRYEAIEEAGLCGRLSAEDESQFSELVKARDQAQSRLAQEFARLCRHAVQIPEDHHHLSADELRAISAVAERAAGYECTLRADPVTRHKDSEVLRTAVTIGPFDRLSAEDVLVALRQDFGLSAKIVDRSS